MDVARRMYSRDLKIAAMREIDAGEDRRSRPAFELSPKLLERWRGEWQARGEPPFPASAGAECSQALTSCTDRRAGAQDRPADDGE